MKLSVALVTDLIRDRGGSSRNYLEPHAVVKLDGDFASSLEAYLFVALDLDQVVACRIFPGKILDYLVRGQLLRKRGVGLAVDLEVGLSLVDVMFSVRASINFVHAKNLAKTTASSPTCE